MNSITKKIMICSLVGITQLGLGASVGTSVIEASPLYYEDSQHIVQLDDRCYEHDSHYEHERRRHEEERRHEREMRRRHYEREQEWHDRQERENERHNNTINEIEAGIVGILIGSALSN